MSGATVDQDCVFEIGAVAGEIYHLLQEHGPMSQARVAKEIAMPRDLVMQGIGWLAREDKLRIYSAPRGRMICLRTDEV